MELEDLKRSWNELNAHVKENELTNRNVLLKMLQRQKESSIQRFWRLHYITLVVLVVIWAATVFLFGVDGASRIPGLVYYFLFLVIVFTGASIYLILQAKKIKDGSRDLETQLKRILHYKVFQKYVLIGTYLLVTPLIVLVVYYNPFLWFRLLISLVLVVGVLIDYFLYHHWQSTLQVISESSKELEDLKQNDSLYA